MSKTSEPAQGTSGAGVPGPNAGLERSLKIVVAVLGLLILVGLGAVIARMVSLASGDKATATASSGQSALEETAGLADTGIPETEGQLRLAAEQSLELPTGATVRSVSLSGGRLAVHYDAPDGAGIAIQDLKTGKTLSRVRLQGPAAR